MSSLMVIINRTAEISDMAADTAENREDPEWLRTFRACVIVVLVTVIVCGNTLVIAAVIKFRSLRCNANCMIVSLSFTDLFVGLVVLPLVVYVQIAKDSRSLLLCYIISHAEPMICFVALLHIVMLNIERYISIQCPLRYHVLLSGRVKFTLIALPWALATVETIANCLFIDQQHHSGHCRFYPSSITATVLSAVLTFLIPFLILVAIYIRIACAIHKHLNQAGDNTTQSLDPSGFHNALGNRGATSVPKKTLHKKTLVMVSLIVGTFTLCWGPYVASTVIYSYLEGDSRHFMMHYLIPLTELMVYAKSAVNPWIYAFCCPQFRRAFRLMCVARKRPRQTFSLT